MRNIIIVFFITCFSFSGRAQDSLPTCIKIAPLTLPVKLRVDMEQVVNYSVSIGMNLQYYYYESLLSNKGLNNISFPGFKAELYARKYLNRHAPTGDYLMAYAGFGNFKDDSNKNIYFMGGGAAAGRQIIIKNTGLLLDFSIAYQIYGIDYNATASLHNGELWYLIGQGAIRAIKVSIGTMF